MKITFFTTGGTIDKVYFDKKSEFQVGEPQIAELLREANVCIDYEIRHVMRKDSLDMDRDDRRLIREHVASSPGERCIVTHGTDTMIDTALALLDVPGKTIVLTGAMQPARLRVSDAEFNVGFAIGVVRLLPHGVYIAMNADVFDPRRARKNVDLNRFEHLA
ncbi:MAG: asparaginase domain-containing protein [Gammaproteobacteria bacterium]|nr:asparaginase domain-containing protein [Gammaproteobacteria bacterium]